MHSKQALLWGILTALQSPDNQHLFVPSHMNALMEFSPLQEIACSWFPGIAGPTSDTFWSRDTITTRGRKATSLDLYAVQMKDRKPGFGYFQLRFPFIIQ